MRKINVSIVFGIVFFILGLTLVVTGMLIQESEKYLITWQGYGIIFGTGIFSMAIAMFLFKVSSDAQRYREERD